MVENPIARPYRPVDLDRSDFQKFPIPRLVDQLMAEKTFIESGRTALSLVSAGGFASVLTVVRAGMRCDPHEAPVPGMLLGVRGRVTVTTKSDSDDPSAKIELEEGEGLALAPGLRHDLEAASDCAYLLVMGADTEG